MFAFILEGLGSTELLFILVIALIFFGPRKLPQLARSMGKGMAEFRKASDDFKRTWEREVALETSSVEEMLEPESQPTYDTTPHSFSEQLVQTPDSELVVARENPVSTTPEPEPVPVAAEAAATHAEVAQAEPVPMRKQEWL